MRLGFCLSAFVFGCFMAVYLRANAPSDLSAKNVQAAQLVDLDQIAQETQPTKMEVAKRTFGATKDGQEIDLYSCCLLYTSPSPRDQRGSRMPSSA